MVRSRLPRPSSPARAIAVRPMDGGRRRRRMRMDSPLPLSSGFDYNHFSSLDGDWRRRPTYVEYFDTPEGLHRHGHFSHLHGIDVFGDDLHGPPNDDHADRRMRYVAVTVVLGDDNDNDDDNRNSRVADDDATLRRQLPVVAPASGANCAICLQDLVGSPEEDEEAIPRAMPCSHAFHERCIFRWIRQNRDCPLCRRTLPTPEQQEYSYDDDDRLQMTMPVPREMLEIEVL